MATYSTTLGLNTAQHDEALKRSTEQVGKLGKEYDAVLGASGKFTKTIQAQMKETKRLLQTLEATGRTNTVEYKQAQKALADLTDQMGDMNAAAKMMASDTLQFDVALKSIRGLMGAMAALQAVTSLTGGESKTLSKIMKGLSVSVAVLTAGIGLANLAQKQFLATFVSTPWGMAITAAAALGGILAGLASSEDKAAKSVKEFNAEMNKQKVGAYAEISQMDALIRIAKDVKRSYNERAGAVKELNSKYPGLKASLVGENGQLQMNTAAYNDYRDAIIAAAGAKAYEKKIQEEYEEKIELEEKLAKARKDNEYKQAHKNDTPLVAPEYQGESVRRQIKEATAAQKLVNDLERQLQSKVADIQKLANESAALTLKANKTKPTNTEYKSTTTPKPKPEELSQLEALEKLLSKLNKEKEKLYKVDENGNVSILDENKLEEINSGIATTTNQINNLKKALGLLNEEEKKSESIKIGQMGPDALSSNFGSLAWYEEWAKELQDKLNNTDWSGDPEGLEKTKNQLIEVNAEIKKLTNLLEISADRFAKLKEQAGSLGSIGSSLKSAASSLKEIGGIDFVGVFDVAGTISQAIANMILSYTTAVAQAAKMGPIAWAAFAATGLAETLSIIASLKSAGAFANGGIIGGTTTVGDYNLARVNKGEMILNQREQTRLWHMLSGSGASNLENQLANVQFHISGNDLVGTLSNYNRKKNRVQ